MTDTVEALDAGRARACSAAVDGGGLGLGPRCLLTAFTLLTALATHQLLVMGGHTDRHWAWTIQSRPTVAFLGAAYAAGFLLSVLGLRQRSWAHVRVAVSTVTAFTVLTLAATVLHAHRLHLTAGDPLARSAAWIWSAVYVVVPFVGLAVIVRQRTGTGSGAVRSPLPARLRWVLVAQGLVLAATGAALFAGGATVHHGTGPMTEFWPWALAPLGAQVLGAWLVALGVGAALVVRERDLAHLRVPAVAYTAFGVFQWAVLLRHRDEVDPGAPATWAYAALLTVVVATGGYGWWTVHRRT
ncbi:hypothetical protein SAMN05660464_4331 [Geodermatophilus dictyosporus]|uniref:Uncharacterized protein n=1 Tax=Geodermatophilus dictyosporus TaxID=1523247 RepID=A0A1I5TH75_9ACTN|nr:hypothetical protein [Geodermatophilus dictyosporus]SFP82410.1 hypothetical protein SAMN05660464_4331 [Geodermatophilus dictyosporus]